ncbi:MAG: hypothetical protein NC390_02155 [Fusobacterium sp.]|nr:hypothetical protein [Fusobacterium sp.]
MNEKELNTIMSVVTDPIQNVYKIETRKDLEEISRIIRIMDMAHEQHYKHTMFSVRSLLALKLVMSNN